MKQKLAVTLFGLAIGAGMFYTPPQLKFLPVLQSERLIIWLICVVLVTVWTTALVEGTRKAIYASVLFSIASCVGYQVVVSVYRFRVGMTFHLVSWDRFIIALCMSMFGSMVVGFLFGKATLKLKG